MKNDFFGIATSSLCAIHCLATPFVIAWIPASAGELWESPIAHYSFAALVSFFCISAALTGYRKHHDIRIVGLMSLALVLIVSATLMPTDDCCESNAMPLLVAGSLAMIAGHIFNYRKCCNTCEPASQEAAK